MQPVGKNSNFKGTNILLFDSKNSYKLDLYKNCLSLSAILLTKIIVNISEPKINIVPRKLFLLSGSVFLLNGNCS